MQLSGVRISCATDLPLLVDDIPESIYCACGGYFADEGEAFNPRNTLSVGELLRAWSWGGAINLGCEAVLDGDVFAMPVEDVRGTKVCLTFVDGRKVFDAL